MTPKQLQIFKDAVASRLSEVKTLKALTRQMGQTEKTLWRTRINKRDPTKDEIAMLGIDWSVWSAAKDQLTIDNFLRQDYSENYPREFAVANRTIWITGLDLRRITQRYKGTKIRPIHHIETAIREGVKVKILVVDPRSKAACKYAAMQELGEPDTERFQQSVASALRLFCHLRSGATSNNPEIKTIDYPLNYGIDAMDAETHDGIDNGIIYVRFYPFFDPECDDRPIVRLTPSERHWYDFYRNQFNLQWESGGAKNWRCGQEKSISLKQKRT